MTTPLDTPVDVPGFHLVFPSSFPVWPRADPLFFVAVALCLSRRPLLHLWRRRCSSSPGALRVLVLVWLCRPKVAQRYDTFYRDGYRPSPFH